MYMSERERNEIIEFLLVHTYYDREYLTSIKNHAQLFSMYKRTEERLASYPKEIIAYYDQHPEIYIRPTNEEIRAMKYNELADLRKELGLSKRGKKVTKTESAPDIAQRARKAVQRQTTTELAATIITSEIAHEHEPEYLTSEEIAAMYPGEEYTQEELFERGVIETPYFGPEEFPRYGRKH